MNISSSSIVFAQSPDDVEFQKALASALKNCYDEGSIGREIKELKDYKDSNSILKNNGSFSNPLPNGYTDFSSLSCKELLSGKSSFSGLYSLAGVTPPVTSSGYIDDEAITTYLTGMGYKTKTSGDGAQKCVQVYTPWSETSFGTTKTKDYSTAFLCFDIDSNEKITSDKVTKKNVSGYNDTINFDVGTSGEVKVSIKTVAGNQTMDGDGTAQFKVGDSLESVKASIIRALSSAIVGYNKDASNYGKDVPSENNCYIYYSNAWGVSKGTYCMQQVEGGSYFNEVTEGSFESSYVVDNASYGYNAAHSYLNLKVGVEYTSAETFVLYQNYLINYYNVEWSCADMSEMSEQERAVFEGQFDGTVRLYNRGEFRNCYVKTDAQSKTKTVNGIENKRLTSTQKTYQDILDALNNDLNNVVSLTDEQASRITGSDSEGSDDFENQNDDGTTGTSDVEKTCANQGGAGSLGWIVCPIMTWLGNAAQDAYEDFVEPSLRIEPKLFSEGNEGVRNGWETFRNIANIAFIILLLVVIFSQLTGVGIDNYGIKKILPKLIVAAILINLSYLICILAVDLSNILGNALRSLFDGLSANLGDVSLNIPNAELNDGAIGKTVLTGIGVLGALVLMVGSIWQNPAILLSMLVGALGVAISIFFLFLLLAVREAAIVVLMVISPLAVACYMLPNTKKLFDKWLKFFEGLLLVYPICGLLVGGGNYVSTLLLSAGFGDAGFLQAFTAMIVGIVPIFFIPTVLKGSFAAMGTIGGKLAGLGKGASGLATKKIRSSEGYKAAQVRGLERKTRKKAGLDAEGQPTWKGAMKSKIAGSRLGRAFGYQKLQAARVSAANKTREQDIQQAAELKDIGMKYDVSNDPTKSTEERLTEKLDAAAASGDTNEIFSVIEQMKRSNMQASHIAQATRKAIGNNLNIKDDGKRKNFLEEFGKKYSGDFLKKDFEQADWARKGGVGVNGISALGVGGQWASRANAAGKTNMTVDDMKDEDVAALSSDRLYDMIAAGVISQPQAQRVWSANGNMDDTNRLILGAYGNEGMMLSKQQAQQQLNPRTRTMDEKTVKAYTERAATDTRIRDVDWRDSKGMHQQTDPLINQQRDGGSSAGNNGGSELKIDHKKFSDERMSDGQSGYD